ncbi:MAG TPA: redoxin domain-containing protein [Anaerolineae bacterium]|nr:redoxin domain-containing protein [Anaerolineae bacterium]
MTRLQWTLVIILSTVVGGGWTWLSRAPDGLDDVASPVAGRPAPDFTLQTTDGQRITLGDLRGQVVILNFWATWCPPCRTEMPALQEVYDARRAEGLLVLAVDQAEAPDVVRSFGAELQLTFPLVPDPDYVVSEQYRISLLPSTFFIGRDGVIREVVFGGPMNRALLESKIAPLLEAR